MDTDLDAIAQRYRRFAEQEARGSSASFEQWAGAVAQDEQLLSLLAQLPQAKQQPNLVFAAARWHGAQPGNAASLRHTLLDGWPDVQATIVRRFTQTNEPARCAVLLPVFHRIPGPVALIELGAAAGLCLIPDRYSYRYSDGTVIDPSSGPSATVIHCELAAGAGLPDGLTTPEIVWRAGVDLNPLDPSDPDTAAWLDILIWPEHEDRRQRLNDALATAAANRPRIDRADLLDGLQALLDATPTDATVVIQHSATFAYLDSAKRAAVTDAIIASGARWISFEGRGAVRTDRALSDPNPSTLFVAALDRTPIALADGHAHSMTLLDDD